MDRIKLRWWRLPKPVRRGIVFMAGWIVVVVGIALLVLPGPGWVLIFFGLAILATEFAYAARLRDKAMRQVRRGVSKVRKNKQPKL